MTTAPQLLLYESGHSEPFVASEGNTQNASPGLGDVRMHYDYYYYTAVDGLSAKNELELSPARHNLLTLLNLSCF